MKASLIEKLTQFLKLVLRLPPLILPMRFIFNRHFLSEFLEEIFFEGAFFLQLYVFLCKAFNREP